jgi:hypothetical protein
MIVFSRLTTPLRGDAPKSRFWGRMGREEGAISQRTSGWTSPAGGGRQLKPPGGKRLSMRVAGKSGRPCNSGAPSWNPSRESEYQPSQTAVQAVTDAYTSEKPWKRMIAGAEFTQILFDSLRQPAWVGVRSSIKPSRQLTVEAEPFVIDLQMEAASARQRISLAGQVLNSRTSQAMGQSADVVLVSADHFVQRTKAKKLGEFCLDFGREQNLRLFINSRGERAIGIVLRDLESSETNGERGSE